MAKVENIESLIAKLKARAAKYEPEVSVIVGYTSAVALFVHENREAKWKGKPRRSGIGVYWGPSLYGPGFLLGPARYLSKELAKIINTALKGGAKVRDALLLAGLRLQRESQKLVPVEHGNLRATAFTRIDNT